MHWKRDSQLRLSDSPDVFKLRRGLFAGMAQNAMNDPASTPIDLENLTGHQRAAVEALQKQVVDLKGQVADLEQLNARQESLIRELQAALFGKSSEKLSEDERQFAAEDLEVALGEVESEADEVDIEVDADEADESGSESDQDASSGTGQKKKKKKPNRNLGHLPKHLPRVEQVIEPESTECPCGCGQMHRIGEDRSERLEIIPAQVQVIVTVRPKYACRSCNEGVTQAAAPAHIIEGGLPSEGAIAYVLVAKYADFLPLYRQSQILMRSDLDIHRSTLAGWVGKASFHLAPVVDRLAEHLKTSSKLFMDETTAPVLDPGRGKTKGSVSEVYAWAADCCGEAGPRRCPPDHADEMEPSQIAVQVLRGDAAIAAQETLQLAVAAIDRLNVEGIPDPLSGRKVQGFVANAHGRSAGRIAAMTVRNQNDVGIQNRFEHRLQGLGVDRRKNLADGCAAAIGGDQDRHLFIRQAALAGLAATLARLAIQSARSLVALKHVSLVNFDNALEFRPILACGLQETVPPAEGRIDAKSASTGRFPYRLALGQRHAE